MKRFYKEVSVGERDNLFTVLLDGKAIKTPEKSQCLMPTKIMAEAVAKEWDAQEKEVKPDSMPLTKLMNTAIDRVGKRRSDLIDELIGFAGSDQICYRADHPSDLVELQNNLWNPLLKRIEELHGIKLKLTTGIVFIDQDEQDLIKIRTLIERIESYALTAFYGMATVAGSITIGINLFEGHINSEQAWEAGHLDENFQVSQWGSDYEAEDRRQNLRAELENATYFLTLC